MGMANDKESFDQWFDRMDKQFGVAYGLGLRDLVDIDYYALYESGGVLEDVIDALADEDELFGMMIHALHEED